MAEVRIDGVLYVPVSEAHIDAAKMEDAIVGGYMGEDWRTEYPDSPGYLRVIVSDNPEDSIEGESVAEFIARVIG